MALIIDVETIGLPDRDGLLYGEYHSFENLAMYDSCRIVQISLMLCNKQFEPIELKDFIVKTDGFTINNSDFHGITNEISENKGIPFSEIAKELVVYLKQASHIIAHNAAFDVNIIKSELYRIGMHEIISEMNTKEILCTMKYTKFIVNARNSRGVKYPSLSELYTCVVKEQIENAHNSKYDVINLHKIIKIMYDSHMEFNIF